MRTYLHQPRTNVSLIEDVADKATARDLMTIDEGDFVFLDEGDEPIEVDVTIVEIIRRRGREPGHHHHLHRHPCRHITIVVHYNATTADLELAPNATIETVHNQAVHKLRIDAVNAADLVLRVPGTTTDLTDSTPIGTLTHTCRLELDLLPGHREAG